MEPAHGNGVELVCKQGHPVTKYKKLRAWQGHTKDRACSGCAQPIDRKDFRWRCNHHCDWDLCEVCYDRHWTRVIHSAAKVQDPALRLELLEAVPGERRPSPDDPPFSPSKHPPRQGGAAAGSAGAASEASSSVKSTFFLLIVLACAWVASAMCYSSGATKLLSGGDKALFPDPWLLSGVAHIGGAIVCKAIAYLTKYDAEQDKEAVDTMSASVVGLMYGLENGLYAKVLCDVAAESRHDVYVLRPLVLAASGVLAGTNKPSARLVVSVVCVLLGSWLTSTGGAGFLTSFPWIALAGGITIFRWVFTLNVLPRHGGLPSLWCFAGQMMWPSGLVGFEIAFMSNHGSYRQLLHLPNPLEVLKIVPAIALACGLQLLIEFRVVQASSLWTLGLCIPLLQVSTLGLSVVTSEGDLTLSNLLGVALYGVALVVEAAAFLKERASGTDANGYLKLAEESQVSSPPEPWHSAQEARSRQYAQPQQIKSEPLRKPHHRN